MPVAPQEEYESLKTAFLAIISHELYTPLTEIITAASLLSSDSLGPLNADQRDYVQMIQTSSHHLQSLIADLISFSQLRAQGASLQPAPAELAVIVNNAVASYRQPAATARVALVEQIEANLPAILIDPLKIARVISNLVANALSHTPPGGTVTIRLQSTPQGQCVQVTDTGKGIPQDRQGHIFESFYQAEPHLTRERGGLGLGLAFARQIVEAHHGTISFVSTQDQGTAFSVVLPLAPP